jgi:hypothetical protein
MTMGSRFKTKFLLVCHFIFKAPIVKLTFADGKVRYAAAYLWDEDGTGTAEGELKDYVLDSDFTFRFYGGWNTLGEWKQWKWHPPWRPLIEINLAAKPQRR